MAQASGIKKAQAIKLCELCQEGSIKWRCINCVQSICEKCKTIHTRGATTAKHQIVTITTLLKDLPKMIVLDNIPCKDHVTRMACMFCQTCDCLVCTECVSTNHSKHQFVPLETSVDRKLDKLRSTQANIIDILKYCESKYQKIQKIKWKYQKLFDESVQKIQQKERELKDAIGKYSTKLQTKLNYERSKAEDALSKVEKHIYQVRKELEKQRDGIENAFKITKGAEIFEIVPSIQTPEITFDSLPKEVEHFFPKAEQATKIKDSFGTLQKIKVDIVRENLDLKVLRTFTTNLPHIDILLAGTDISAWISNSSNEMIQKFDIVGDNITKSKEFSIDLVDMDFTANNDILFSDYQSSDVKLLSQSGEIKPFLSVKPLLPKGIHVTKNNEIILGVRESVKGDHFKVTKKSQRAVMIFDMNGKQKCSYQFDNKGQTLFNVPYRIITNINQDILVNDLTSVATGRVVCLDQKGRVKFIYKGHTEINAKEEFDPRDLAITSIGHVIVSDYSSNTFHVLSETGELLFCKDTEVLGISYPWTIDIDRKGQLWIGCGTGPGIETGAKIHIVKLLW